MGHGLGHTGFAAKIFTSKVRVWKSEQDAEEPDLRLRPDNTFPISAKVREATSR